MKLTDKVIIAQKTSLSSDHLNSLMMLYLPSTNQTSVACYLLLVSLSHSGGVFSSRKLCDILNIDIDSLNAALLKCEQFQLISTYQKQETHHNTYVLSLHLPLKINAFLKHDVFGRYLHKVLDVSYIEELKEVENDLSLDGFKNMTRSFDSRLLENWEAHIEADFNNHNIKTKTLPDSLSFNMKLFLQTTPQLLLPEQARSKENLDVIQYLGSLYALDVVTMRKFVGQSTNYNQGSLDKAKLETLITRYMDKNKTATSSTYDNDSYVFFSAQQKGKALGVRDKKTIAFLYEHYDFDQAVQNHLIEFVLSRFKGSFTKSLVQQIADSWVRAKIKSVDDVKKHLSYEAKPSHVISTPSYMEDTKKQVDPKDEAERKALLEKLKKGD